MLLSRASDDELKQISIAKSDVAKGALQSQGPSGWSADDLRFARSSETTLTFRTKSGLMVTNAQIKPYIEGVSLLWRDSNGGGGIVRLADLSEELQRRFGYDPVKASAAASAERDKRARDLQQQARANAAAADAQLAQARVRAAQASDDDGWNLGSFGSSVGGSVYVRGYTRRDGTYVHGYTRRR